ncbi:ATP-binding cassette domain-containing protein [Streptomyces sp. NPDC005955]|uniref:ATP-binding cassette domain-containing protein n=1 Tax=Streptomyces sp. NPDC005955 TaxID=3364738 RepID=UPI0036BF837E
MIQAIGLTSTSRKETLPTVADVSFDAPTGRITALLGPRGAGKSTVLRLMLELQPGRGTAHFRGRPLHRIPHPAREVGVVLGEVPGHPARTVRGHLRMLCAAAGVPGGRADDVLEATDLDRVGDTRLGCLSHGMDRRLALACALLADPHTLVLDAPTDGLATPERSWLHHLLRSHAGLGGTVLFSTDDAREAARTADRVVTLEAGRVIADQEAVDFARTRLRPRVAVRSPHAVRLARFITQEARAARQSVEVVNEAGNRLSVYGSTCAEIGELAYRHGILVHQLADETGDTGPRAGGDGDRVAAEGDPPDRKPPPAPRSPARLSAPASPTDPAAPVTQVAPTTPTGPISPMDSEEAAPGGTGPLAAPAAVRTAGLDDATHPPRTAAPSTGAEPRALPPAITVRPVGSPLRPVRYELRRATGIATGYVTCATALVVSAVLAVFLARTGHEPPARLLAAWPEQLPLPPAALGAGLLGALAFGDEFRHPALAADRGTVPRRLGLLGAKLTVAAATALLLAVVTVGCDALLLGLVYGGEVGALPSSWPVLAASWIGLVTGCSWAGVLAAGTFKSTAAGLAAVLAVPVLVVPGVQKVLSGPSVRTAAGLPARLHEFTMWPFGAEKFLVAGLRMITQPVGSALTLSLAALLCAYLLTVSRSRVR